ncbi:type VI secretion system baseplate subunit TssG [Klebsiella variicola]|uniref:type VI secretion system baseplate subunit TssG n=1 Tax=Klebsiella variicola TaxID=244366 RepID=UPI00277BC125|nr:type VI secretion system baseplate subunit TssG [Klebsiella variicola]
MDNPAILLRRLNPYSARAMEGAASLCQTRSHAEILPEHWLLKLLEQGEGDLTVLARRYTWDMDAIWQDLLTFMDKLPRSVRSRPQLSDAIQTLMQEAWLRASLEGEEQIRSLHLLMALVEKPIRCDGLWPLLTLAQSQLERLHPVLDAQSDERLEVQQVERLRPSLSTRNDDLSRDMGVSGNNGLSDALRNALDKFTLDVTARARDGKIDPVFGRDNEIRQMVDILSRRRKNNPILVGEPGVGKTALVEGLALRVAEGNVPDSLKPVTTQYYRIWRKYAWPATFEAGGRDATSQCLLGLVGLGIPGTAEQVATPVSRFLALLGTMRLPTRNAEGIRALVSLLAPNTRAIITEPDPVKVHIGNRSGLGTGNRIRLSQRATLGKTAKEACCRVLVTLETADPDEAEGWLPGGALHTDLLVLLRVYLGYRSDARLRLTVPVRLLPEPRLSTGRRIQLGRTGLLGLKAGKLSNSRESLTVSLGCYEGLQCSVLSPAEDGHYRFD